MRQSRAKPSRLIGKEIQPLPLLTLFLILVFFTGGSSWSYESQLIALRPAAAFTSAWGLATMRREHCLQYWQVWSLFGGAVLLTAVHLVPLPFAWWSALPGRQILVDIDSAARFGKIWRPLSMDPNSTVNALLSLLVPLAALSLAVQLSEHELRRLVAIVIALGLVSAMAGALQVSGVHLALYEISADPQPSGLFKNRNHQGALLAALIPLVAIGFRGGFGGKGDSRMVRWVAGALVALLVPLLIITGSRSGVVLAAASLVFAGLMLLGQTLAQTRKRAILVFGAFVLVLVVLALLTTYFARDVAFQRLPGSDEDMRFAFWESTWSMMPHYWPFGTGIGSYASSYEILEPDTLLRPTFTNHAHNDILEVAFTAGLPGVVLMVLGLIAALLRFVRVHRSVSGSDRDLAIAGAATLLIFTAASVTDYPMRTPIILALFVIAAVWLLWTPRKKQA